MPASTDSHEPVPAIDRRRDLLVLILTMMPVPMLAIQLFNSPNPRDLRILRHGLGFTKPTGTRRTH